jgi:hypothetical protein
VKRTTVSLAAATRLGVAALAVAGLVAGCSGSASSPSSGSTPTASQSGGFGGPGAGADPALQAKIQECLKAAGIAITVPTGRPSGAPSGMPSGAPSGMPSGAPSGAPSGMPSGAPSGAARGMFDSPQIQAALAACGITLPSRTAGGTPSPASS